MTTVRGTLLFCAGSLLVGGSVASAQAIPSDTTTPAPGVGFSLPQVGGTLSSAVSASEVFTENFYNSGGFSNGTNLSGDVAYLSRSQRHPFSAVYAGGVLIGNGDQPTTVYQSLSFSQSLATKHWNFVLGDTVSYLPEGPLGGLSGIPGVGDLGVDPVSVVPTGGIGILTTYGPRISNTVSGSASRQLSNRFYLQASGNYSVQRFIGDNANLALNSTTVGGTGGLSYRATARDTVSVNYNYSRFSYSGRPYEFSAQGATVEYSRHWSPRLITDAYAGPQIISGSNNTVLTGTSTQIAAGASASYLSRRTTYTLAYARGANNGSGVVPGAFSDSLTGAAHRQFARKWDVSGSVGFARTTSLPNLKVIQFDSKGVSFGAQVSRGFGRHVSAFGTFSVQDQSTNASGLGAYNAYNGVYNIFGIGITYSPRTILLGR